MTVFIGQLLCPQRHCILALAGEYEDAEEAKELALKLGYATAALIGEGKPVNPWCGICEARDFTIDIQPTRFSTMAEAMPELKRLEQEQMMSSMLLRRSVN